MPFSGTRRANGDTLPPARCAAVPGTGTGLGLGRAITAAHHGTITLNDLPHAGTSFTVRLPHDPRRMTQSAHSR
ncbi:hypothetical protein Axi01nite_97360 [Actinoplanes xinjiangensis]|nr:hypothetical protein Axi01nite_97360 [Actinoplanes xinjiangensis]